MDELLDPRLRLVVGTDLARQSRAVLEALDRVRVIVRSGPSDAANVAVVALAARMFAHVTIAKDAAIDLPGMPLTLGALLDRLSWMRPVPATDPVVDRVIAVGPTAGYVDLGIGGGAWTVRMGRSAQPIDDEPGPELGLRVAAGLAVAELVKEALTPLGWVSRQLDEDELVWNLLDYQLTAAPAATLSPGTTGSPLLLAGVGSVGTSVIAALASYRYARPQSVLLVDPELFDSRNPYRYPDLIDDVTGTPKADWARAQLGQAGIHTVVHQDDIGSWTAAQTTPGFEGLLLASPDTVDGRRDVTDALARDTITIGVAGLAFHVARHRLGDGLACPYCQCVPLGPPTTQAGVYAAQTGLSIERTIQLLQPHAVLTEADLAQVRASSHLPIADENTLAGHRLEDLIARIYAEIQIPVQNADGHPQQVTLAAPYVSLVAGTIAAAEIRKSQLGLPMVDRRVDLDLTGLPQGIVRRPAADPSGRCLCASPFRRRWMRRMYPAA